MAPRFLFVGMFSVVMALGALSGCGPTRYVVALDAPAVGADAEITAGYDSGLAVSRVGVTVKNLAPPDRIMPGGSVFVVWARRNSDVAWKRIGALQYNVDTRDGKLVDVTVPEKNFELQVTVETHAEVESASGTVLVLQRVG